MVQSIYEYLLQIPDDPIEMTQQEIRENLDLSLSSEAVGTALQWISRTGVLERLEAGAGLAMVRISSNLPTLVDLLPKTSERRRKVLRVLERAVGDRRYETVYVHPRWLMDQTKMDRSDLNDVLRELCKLDAVEYVPPFRGRAVHFRRRDVRFEDLRIDFEAFERMKEAEYEKLEQVIAFAESKRCRQLSVLQYFGDPSAASCGLCDRCLHRVGWFALAAEGMVVQKGASQDGPQVDEGLPTECQAILRRILQAASKTNGRLGKILFAQYLAGSENAKLQRLRLHLLPDFSLLSPLTQSEIGSLLDRLLAAGLLEQHEVNRHRPTLSVSQVGMQVAFGAQPFPNGFSIPVGLQRRLVAVASERVGAGFGKSQSVLRYRSPIRRFFASMPPAAHEKMQDGLTGRAASGETDNGTVSIRLMSMLLPPSRCARRRKRAIRSLLHRRLMAHLKTGTGHGDWPGKVLPCSNVRRFDARPWMRFARFGIGGTSGSPFSILDLLDRDAGVAAQKIMDDMLEKSGEQMSAVPAFDSHPLIRRYPSMAGLLRAIAEKTVERSLSRPST